MEGSRAKPQENVQRRSERGAQEGCCHSVMLRDTRDTREDGEAFVPIQKCGGAGVKLGAKRARTAKSWSPGRQRERDSPRACDAPTHTQRDEHGKSGGRVNTERSSVEKDGSAQPQYCSQGAEQHQRNMNQQRDAPIRSPATGAAARAKAAGTARTCNAMRTAPSTANPRGMSERHKHTENGRDQQSGQRALSKRAHGGQGQQGEHTTTMAGGDNRTPRGKRKTSQRRRQRRINQGLTAGFG